MPWLAPVALRKCPMGALPAAGRMCTGHLSTSIIHTCPLTDSPVRCFTWNMNRTEYTARETELKGAQQYVQLIPISSRSGHNTGTKQHIEGYTPNSSLFSKYSWPPMYDPRSSYLAAVSHETDDKPSVRGFPTPRPIDVSVVLYKMLRPCHRILTCSRRTHECLIELFHTVYRHDTGCEITLRSTGSSAFRPCFT